MKRDAQSGAGWERLLGLATEFPRLTLAGVFLLVVGMGAGLPRLQFSNDIRVFFSKENPQLQAYEALEQTYSKGNSVLFVVEPRSGDVFTREALAALERLTDRAWQMPYSRRVDSLSNFQWTEGIEDDLVVGDFVENAAGLTDAELAALREAALSEPLLVNRLVSERGHVAGVNVPVDLPGKDPLREQPEVATFARQLAAEIEQGFPVRVRLTGIVMINQALSEAGTQDMLTLVPLMFAVVIGACAWLLRSWAAAAGALLVIVCAIAAALGAAGWLGILISPPVVSAANMIMTLAVVDSVHVLSSFRAGLAEGRGKAPAMRQALRTNFAPVFFTSFTTALGFLSMNMSDSPPFRDLGNIVALGVLAAWVWVMTLLPALMVLAPAPRRPRAAPEGGAWFDRLSRAVLAGRRRMLIGGAVITLLAVAFIPRNQLNDEFVTYFDESMEFRQDTEFTIQNLTGFEYIEYSIDSGEPGGIAHPEYLRKLDAFAAWYRQQPKVRHVHALTDILKRLNRSLHQEDPAYYRVPEERELAAQYLLLYELSLPFGLDLNDQIDVDKSASRVRVSLANITSQEMLELDRAAQAWLQASGLSPHSEGTGQSLMFAHIGLRNIKSLLGSTVAALVLISLLLVFITRSVKFGLLTLAPNLAPAGIAFGMWGLWVGEVGLALSVVVGMTLGIVVDDTIHFLMKYLQARREKGLTPEAALQSTFRAVGPAMSMSTFVLATGFGVLAFSKFELNSSMGLLSAVTIVIALAFDWFVLPPLLLLLDRPGSNLEAAPSAGSEGRPDCASGQLQV